LNAHSYSRQDIGRYEPVLYEKLQHLLRAPANPILPAPFRRWELACNTLGIVSHILIGPEVQERLHACLGWLDDDAMNGLSQLLHLCIQRQSWFLHNGYGCAVFSTHMFTLASNKVSNHSLFRNCRYTRYWNQPVWIIPIHLPHAKHWKLAVVAHASRTILMYDSQGISNNACEWKKDLKVYCTCTAAPRPFSQTHSIDYPLSHPSTYHIDH
jgi:hypothetical protein